MNERKVRTLERVFKGMSNHYRIKILLLIENNSDITLREIVDKLKTNYYTTSEHVNRLKIAGLIYKKYKGKYVTHNLSPYGEKVIKILTTFLD